MMTTTDQDILVVARDNAATKPPLTSSGRYYPVNGAGDCIQPLTTSEMDQGCIGDQQVDLTEARGHEEPPPPVSTKTIPLPALADIPIFVNPVLAYNPSKIVLEYNLGLPPSTACLLPTTATDDAHQDWRQQPAMDPNTVGSMTIMVPGLERFVVVFPATSNSDIVTVDDVLIAVHRAVQAAAMELHREFGTTYGERDLAECGGEDDWWGGLYPCQNEQDVWVLRTRIISTPNTSNQQY
ncbi:hypothetical protein M413DRAFT_12596 [Hebeloma cylindrosporum]|uniref:DUF6699 domain-containing protein n=1 Tax=Hebeloma cylindrosporum TaxID=76867 RepID=A0A0C3C332_HEBCY|nr:hypothetical protein M413DRAFT_12596 [Hebeloma cylindrosporum h7]